MASNTVPSPSLDSFIQGVRDPNALAHKIVQQEAALGHRQVSTPSTPSNAPAAPDLGEAITRTRRGGK